MNKRKISCVIKGGLCLTLWKWIKCENRGIAKVKIKMRVKRKKIKLCHSNFSLDFYNCFTTFYIWESPHSPLSSLRVLPPLPAYTVAEAEAECKNKMQKKEEPFLAPLFFILLTPCPIFLHHLVFNFLLSHLAPHFRF